MNPDDFEKRITCAPLRQPPAEWRAKILAEALTNAPQHHPSLSPITWWRELILPARRAWAGLAAVWVLIAVASLATLDPAPAMAKATAPSQEVQQALRAQHQLRAELIGRIEPAGVNRQQTIPPSPHSALKPSSAIV